MRTEYKLATGKTLPKIDFQDVRGFSGVKDAEINPDGKKIRIAIAHGTCNVMNLLDKIRSGEVRYDFVEIMACYGGCIGGGGQPKFTDPEVLKKRANAIYSIDETAALRNSHENPAIKQPYAEFYGKPLSEKSKKLLHTYYTNRKSSIFERAAVLSKTK